jgi:hypothetical protein
MPQPGKASASGEARLLPASTVKLLPVTSRPSGHPIAEHFR